MVVAIKVPSVGESISEGTIAHWLKKEGDRVGANDPLFELETEKATSTVPAPAAGVLHITADEGQTVPIGSVVGHIDPDGVAAPPHEEKSKPSPPAAKEAERKPAAPPAPPREAERKPAPAASPALSPAVRRLVEEEGVNPAEVPASGRGGRLTKEDVVHFLEQREQKQPSLRALEQPGSPELRALTQPCSPASERETRQRLSAIRQRIAERLVAGQKSAATLTTFNEADLSAVLELRARYKDKFKESYGIPLGFMSFFVKAVALALRAYPVVNSRIDGSDVITYHYCNIGVAVSTEKGLMVPVVRDADRLGFAQIEQTIAELAAKAREGKISVTDLQGGTFTITNGGVFGSLLSTPILNPPQSAILGMHTIQKRPVVVDEQIVIRPMMYLALSYDHRLIDGREAVLFLVRVKECIEDPERLLLEI
jgi:2-oxoglutarate dehydrogenase E2 component (dihydrolipoamide succinyltransferase)